MGDVLYIQQKNDSKDLFNNIFGKKKGGSAESSSSRLFQVLFKNKIPT